jgi:hypothetical protein
MSFSSPRRFLGWMLSLVSAFVACGPKESSGDVVTQVSERNFNCPSTRSTVERADSGAPYQLKLLYVVPTDRLDRKLDTNRAICRSAQAQDLWFRNAAGTNFRYDKWNGALDIRFVRLNKSDLQMRGTTPNGGVSDGYPYVRDRIEIELNAMGVLQDKKLFLVYYDGTSFYGCGGSPWPPTLRGRVVAMYLNGLPNFNPPCSSNVVGASASQPGYWEYSMLHDTLHGLGFVASAVPGQHSAGHVAAPANDLMYAQRRTGDPPWNISGTVLLDANNDQYFRHTVSGLLDLDDSIFLDGLQKPAGL